MKHTTISKDTVLSTTTRGIRKHATKLHQRKNLNLPQIRTLGDIETSEKFLDYISDLSIYTRTKAIPLEEQEQEDIAIPADFDFMEEMEKFFSEAQEVQDQLKCPVEEEDEFMKMMNQCF